MPTQPEVIMEAMKDLGGECRIEEIKNWVGLKYGDRWKDFHTIMADMVPVSHGGNNSSTIASKYRCLKRVSRGNYSLIEAKESPIDYAIEPHFIRNSKKSTNSSIKDNFPKKTPNYVITGAKEYNLIELFSSERLPFEPKGWVLEMRNSLKKRLKLLQGNKVSLHATYKSMDKRFFDIENVLFYNVGTSAFRNLHLKWVQFERVYSFPQHTHEQQQFDHYQSYNIIKEDKIISAYWIKGTPLAKWDNINIPTLKSDGKPHFIWLAMKNGEVAVLNKESSSKYGLEITINAPIGTQINLIATIKPLLDGLISAFHHYEGQELNSVVKRLAQHIHLPESKVETLLLDEKTSILGPRNLLHPYRESLKWNPEDDAFPFFKIYFQATNKNNEWTLSGDIFTVEMT